MPIDFVALLAILANTQLRFVVVGGLAMVLHGIDRLTADADLVVDFSADSINEAVQALVAAGYRPLAPVDPKQFGDAMKREEWRLAKGMKVFSFWDSTSVGPTVDILLESPVTFDELWRDAVRIDVGGHRVAVASSSHLIRMKESAGRPRDLDDVARLQNLNRK